jgi:hypothetical protein
MTQPEIPKNFIQKVVIDFIPLMKWPIIILLIWLITPSDFGKDLGVFIKEVNLTKFSAGGVFAEMDPNKKIQEIKEAGKKLNLSNTTKELLSNLSASDKRNEEQIAKLQSLLEKSKISETAKEALDSLSSSERRNEEEILKFKSLVEKLEKQSSDVFDRTFKIFVPNKNDDLAFNTLKAKAFHFEIYKEGVLIVNIVVGFENLPFNYEFDLCPLSGHYKNLKAIKYDPNRNIDGLEYTDEKVNCKSSVSIAQFQQDSYFYSYDLNILEGFNVAKVESFDVFLPLIRHSSISNNIYTDDGNNVVSSSYKKNKVFERTLVYIK